MSGKFNKQFKINRTELDIIERALREEAGKLSKELMTQQLSQSVPDEQHTKDLGNRVRQIQSLLPSWRNGMTVLGTIIYRSWKSF